MRDLTDAEYRTLLSVLAFPETTEQARIRWSGLPSSTYNVVKRRLYDQAWVLDHWLPSPGPLGFSGVTVSLSRPFAADRPSVESRLVSDPACVLAWSGIHGVLSVTFHRGEESGAEGPGAPGRSPRAATAPVSGPVLAVRTRRSEGNLPVYFDYSGLWARFGGERVPPEYPRGLDLASEPVAARERVAAERAVEQGTSAMSERASRRWANLLRLPRSQRRAVEAGLVQARAVPNLALMPPRSGRRIGEVVIVLGRGRSTQKPGALLNALTKDCGVFPFLYAEADGSTLFAGVGQTSATGPGRVPVRTARRPVMATVNAHLEQVEVLVEPVESLRELVPHRYGALFQGTAVASRPGA